MDLAENISNNLDLDDYAISVDELSDVEIESLNIEYYLETKQILGSHSPFLTPPTAPVKEGPAIKSRKGIKHKKYLDSLRKFMFLSKCKNQYIDIVQVKCPKKEYIRTKLIRGHKRAQRQCFQKFNPDKTIHKIDPNNKYQLKSWEIFKNHVTNFADTIREMSKTENGPLTDGKNRRLLDSISRDVPKTCNDEFVKEYFKSAYMRESFKLYINVIFARQTPKELCERFGFNCCDGSNHLAMCKEIWAELYDQLRNGFIEVHLNENQ